MREIDLIVVHCSATKLSQSVTIDDIRAWHKARGWKDVGYHYLVRQDGYTEKGRPVSVPGAHVRGYNSRSIGVCYEGGLDESGKAADTRTECQEEQLISLIEMLKRQFPEARVCGHRDLSPDKDGDGIVEEHEWLKECPCFDAEKEYQNL